MLQDYKLGLRMLLKFPGLTIAGGLALAIAIGVGAGWYDVWGKALSPSIPLPEGDRIVLIATQNTLTNGIEPRVVHDFLEWRRELRTITELGAYRSSTRNLIVDNAAPVPIPAAELTAAAFRTARVSPLFGRALTESDEAPGAPGVVVLGYDVWQRFLGGRRDVVGSTVMLGTTPAIVIGVMPDGFKYPVNHQIWTPLSLRASYGALEGDAVSVIGRLAPGVTREQANAELRVVGDRAAAALPATHKDLRPLAIGPGESLDVTDAGQIALMNLPVLVVLIIACMNVATLVYARTATREGEIAVRTALGASRQRIIGQLFVEALVLAAAAATVGLFAAGWAMRWGIERASESRGGAPFWFTTGLSLTTILYAGGLAFVSAAILSLLPALKATQARVQSHLKNLGASGATLRFGPVWTTVMIAQVATTAIAIPVALESVNQAMRKVTMRAEFDSGEYLAARIELERPFEVTAPAAFEERRAQTYAALEQRVAEVPGVAAVTFSNGVPGAIPRTRDFEVEPSPGAGRAYSDLMWTAAVGPEFFELFDSRIVAGRAFNGGDRSPAARTVIVNEAFARRHSRITRTASPIGARVRFAGSSAPSASPSVEPWFEIVGVVRDLGLDPEDIGPCCEEAPYVFSGASAGTAAPLFMHVRVRGNPGPLVARLRTIASEVDGGLRVDEARTLDEWLRRRNDTLITTTAAQAGVTLLALFLSALGIYSLLSVNVSRRTREIGLRAALGANPGRVLVGVLSRAMVLLGSGITVGGALLLFFVEGSGENVALFVMWFAVTSAVMFAAGLLASVGPARRALRINPTEALREA